MGRIVPSPMIPNYARRLRRMDLLNPGAHITSHIVMEEFKGDLVSLAIPSEGDISVGESSVVNDFEEHQWIMDTGCGPDRVFKLKLITR